MKKSTSWSAKDLPDRLQELYGVLCSFIHTNISENHMDMSSDMLTWMNEHQHAGPIFRVFPQQGPGPQPPPPTWPSTAAHP